MDTTFREKIEDVPEAEAPEPVELVSDDVQGARKLTEESDEPKEPTNALERWEESNGKYGVEFLGIKEVVGEFPHKMHFGAIDNYIKSEIKERNWEMNTKHYQDIMNELMKETGTEEIEPLAKMEKLYKYIQVIQKYNKIKKEKETFRNSF